MRRLFSFFLLLVAFSLSACHASSAEKTTPASTTQIPSGGSESGSYIGSEINVENAERKLRSKIRLSSMVVEGTLQEKKRIEIEDSANDLPSKRDDYTFEDLQVITGVYEEETLTITSFQGELGEYEQPENFQVGGRYVLIVHTTDSVNYTKDDLLYRYSGILCKLDQHNHEKIDKLYVFGFAMETMLRTKQALIDIIDEEVGLHNTYYNECEQYVHSNVVADIVQGADIVAKVRVDAVDNEDTDMLVEICDCTLLELYKGEISNLEPESKQFRMLPHRNSTSAGKEYLVLLKPFFDPPDYNQAAKKNAIIPMTDTERVNEVYAALGIKPEE